MYRLDVRCTEAPGELAEVATPVRRSSRSSDSQSRCSAKLYGLIRGASNLCCGICLYVSCKYLADLEVA